MVAEASGAGKTNGANPVQTRTYNYDRNAITRSFNTLAATEQQKLQKTNVWDYANAMQAGAYMG